MSRKIFISHEFKDKEVIGTLTSWFKPDGPCEGKPVMVYDPDAQTPDQIDAAIRAEMKECKIAVFVASENVHNKPWIDREVELADSLGLPIVLVKFQDRPFVVPGRLSGRTNVHRVEEWSSAHLCPVLNRIAVRSST